MKDFQRRRPYCIISSASYLEISPHTLYTSWIAGSKGIIPCTSLPKRLKNTPRVCLHRPTFAIILLYIVNLLCTLSTPPAFHRTRGSIGAFPVYSFSSFFLLRCIPSTVNADIKLMQLLLLCTSSGLFRDRLVVPLLSIDALPWLALAVLSTYSPVACQADEPCLLCLSRPRLCAVQTESSVVTVAVAILLLQYCHNLNGPVSLLHCGLRSSSAHLHRHAGRLCPVTHPRLQPSHP